MEKSLKIYKYELSSSEGKIEKEIYKGAKILSVNEQNNKPVLWALVDIKAPLELRKFFVAMTGTEVTEILDPLYSIFLGTIKLDQGAYIIHIFEVEYLK